MEWDTDSIAKSLASMRVLRTETMLISDEEVEHSGEGALADPSENGEDMSVESRQSDGGVSPTNVVWVMDDDSADQAGDGDSAGDSSHVHCSRVSSNAMSHDSRHQESGQNAPVFCVTDDASAVHSGDGDSAGDSSPVHSSDASCNDMSQVSPFHAAIEEGLRNLRMLGVGHSGDGDPRSERMGIIDVDSPAE